MSSPSASVCCQSPHAAAFPAQPRGLFAHSFSTGLSAPVLLIRSFQRFGCRNASHSLQHTLLKKAKIIAPRHFSTIRIEMKVVALKKGGEPFPKGLRLTQPDAEGLHEEELDGAVYPGSARVCAHICLCFCSCAMGPARKTRVKSHVDALAPWKTTAAKGTVGRGGPGPPACFGRGPSFPRNAERVAGEDGLRAGSGVWEGWCGVPVGRA